MADARTWLNKRCQALRIEHETDGDPAMEVGHYLWNLAQEMGAQLRGSSHTQFAMVIEALVTEYSAPPTESAGDPLPVVNGSISTLTPAQLEGAELRFARQAKKLKQNELSDLVDLPNSTISKWENGEFIPTDAQRASMRAVLGLPPLPSQQLPLKGC